MKKKRNGEIDLFKFLCCWVVAFYHFYGPTDEHFVSGRNAVEFFLLSAGVFFFISAEKMLSDPHCTPYDYFKKRWLRFFPHAFVAFVFAFFINRMVIGNIPTFGRIFDYLSGDIWEILLIKMNGMNGGKGLLNGVAWTISAMLIAEFFIFSCLWCFKEKFTHFILPFSLLIGYGFWKNIESAGHAVWSGFTTFGVIRAYLTIGLSYYCLQLAKKISEINFNCKGKAILSVLNVFLYVCILYIYMYKDGRNYQWTSTLLTAIAISIAMSGHSLINEYVNKVKICSFLGELSMSIYLVHGTVLNIFKRLYSDPYIMYLHIYEFIGISLTVAFIHYFVSKYAIKCAAWIKDKLKYSLIKREYIH